MVPLVTLASSFYLSTILYCILLYITDPERRKYGAFGYLGLLILLINNIILYITVYYRPREKEVWCLWLPWPPHPAYQQHYTVYYCILQTQREGSMVPLVTLASSFCLSTILYCILLYITDPERRKYGAFGYLGLLILLINNIILYITVYYRPREKEVWCLWLPWPPHSAYQQHYTVYYCLLQTRVGYRLQRPYPVYRGTQLHTAVRTTVYGNSIKLSVIVNLSAVMGTHLINMPTSHGV